MADNDATLADLIDSLPPHARAGVLAALKGASDRKTSPGEHAATLGKLALTIGKGSAPGIGILLASVEAIAGLLQWRAKRRKAKRRKARRAGTSAGLAAYHASKASERARAKRARSAKRGARRGGGKG